MFDCIGNRSSPHTYTTKKEDKYMKRYYSFHFI